MGGQDRELIGGFGDFFEEKDKNIQLDKLIGYFVKWKFVLKPWENKASLKPRIKQEGFFCIICQILAKFNNIFLLVEIRYQILVFTAGERGKRKPGKITAWEISFTNHCITLLIMEGSENIHE